MWPFVGYFRKGLKEGREHEDVKLICARMDREHWVINEKLDRIEKLLEHEDIAVVIKAHIICLEGIHQKLDRIEKSMRSYDENTAILDRLDRIEQFLNVDERGLKETYLLVEEQRPAIINLCDAIGRMERLLEERQPYTEMKE